MALGALSRALSRMKMAFSHEKLKVYQNALQFTAKADSWVAGWDSKHAVGDHLPRAAESIVENIAMASAAYSGMKVKGLGSEYR